MVLDVLADVGGITSDRIIEINLDNMAELTVVGNPDWIRVLFGNVIANALLHSISPGTVEVAALRRANRVFLSVANDCENLSD